MHTSSYVSLPTAPHFPTTSGPQESHAPKTASQFPTKAEFLEAGEALEYMKADYIPGLSQYAKEFEATHNRKPKDQDFPVELIRVTPRNPKLPPLLIVGGMGPLAGAQAMEDALKKFGDSREVVLLQLCSTPDRTAALNADEAQRGVSDEHRGVVEAMSDGFLNAEQALTTTHLGQPHVIVACNTAHNFAPEAFEKYRELRGAHETMKMDSLVQCVTAELSQAQKGSNSPVVILGTDGTLKTKLYINPLEANGVKCAVPQPEAQKTLMRAIYEGVKAFDPKRTLEQGESLFLQLAAAGQIQPGKPFVVLAACTEVPEIVNTLKEHGSAEVKALLAHAQVADPMAIALTHVARADTPSQTSKY